MTNFYLNHNYLTAKSSYDIQEYINEIARFLPLLRLNNFGLKIREDIWSICLLDGVSFFNYLHQNSGKDEVVAFILGIMNSGPYFSSTPSLRATINPTFQSQLCEELLLSCFEDNQRYILSLENEECLTHANYTVFGATHSLEIQNCIGLARVEHFFENNLILKCIEDVYDQINIRSKKVKVLPSAWKSAKLHNFYGRYPEVLYTILALETIDLTLLKGNINDKERVKEYKAETGFEISRESNGTLNRKRYEAQRLFVIPGLGRKLFEWHIKIGPYTRIHYYIDVETEMIYIGHCGKHLDI
ncbi:hypothetical protein [Paenibacillus elgii]|uniref:hypothetical protein n=1 Tax=Paenibacillus elgii TaxID=189691 RepID=UPI0011B2360D|nr:hypothetical protein [Paenibacillus elgii]